MAAPPTVLAPAAVDALRRQRNRARNISFLGFALVFFGAIIGQFGRVSRYANRDTGFMAALGQIGDVLGITLVGGGLLIFAVGAILWAVFATRLHRAADPWAYDPELDGPDPDKRHELDDSFKEGPDQGSRP